MVLGGFPSEAKDSSMLLVRSEMLYGSEAQAVREEDVRRLM